MKKNPIPFVNQLYIDSSKAGLPHGQEKSGNQEKSERSRKNGKSQVKIGVFEKSQEKLKKKHQIFSV